MKKVYFVRKISLIVILLALLSCSSSGSSKAEQDNFDVMTWVPSYNQTIWKAALLADTGGSYSPKNTLTRLGAQFFQVQSDGTILNGVSDSDIQWISDYCKTNNIKFLLCIHDYDSAGIDNWNWTMAASAFGTNKTALVGNIVNLVNTLSADGVDIDFEGNEDGDPDQAAFASFIIDLGTELHSIGKELTVDIFPYIWNQPNMNWIGDWNGYVDGINSMGYGSLYGDGPDWQSYKWQQDTVLAAGYTNVQFEMGLPGSTGEWGATGSESSTLSHLNELLSGNYNTQNTSVCIWDAQFNGDGWLSAEVWEALHRIRTAPIE